MSNSVAAGCITGGAIGLRGMGMGLLFHVLFNPSPPYSWSHSGCCWMRRFRGILGSH